MVNCNPETVSTDYDTSDRLYFEPLTAEDVIEIIDTERAKGTLHGVIVQFGGQTPLKLAEPLENAKVPILGTSPDAIDLAEDRDRFKQLLDRLKLRQPKSGIATSAGEGARDRRSDRLSDRDPPVLRARRPRHGDRARRAAARPRYVVAACRRSRSAVRVRRVGEAAAADRPLSDRRGRGRRRLPRRRPGHLHRRHHGAHRGGRHPFRRFRLLAAAAFARPGDHRRAGAADARAGAGAQGRRPDERAVRHQGRRHLCARGQSARLAHGAVRRQGDRHSGAPRSRRESWPAKRSRVSSSSRKASNSAARGMSASRRRCSRLRGSAGSRHRARPGDEIDRRGHGHRPRLQRRLRQKPARRRLPAAEERHRIRLGQG